MSDYECKHDAHDAANAVLKKMRGRGWKIEVWENLGWHWCLRNGGLCLHSALSNFGKAKYFCLLSSNDDHGTGGECYWTTSESFTDPNAAVHAQLRAARAFVDSVNATVRRLEIDLKT